MVEYKIMTIEIWEITKKISSLDLNIEDSNTG